jgi:hypothetical protein
MARSDILGVALRKLILFANRLEPVLYRTLVVSDRRDGNNSKLPFIASHTLKSLIHRKSPTFFRDSVRHVSLRNPEAKDISIFAACSAVENLWLEGYPSPDVPALNLPLKRLHCFLDALAPTDFTHTSFASITHLEIFDIASDLAPRNWSLLMRLPHLTHLAFNSANHLQTCLEFLPTWDTLRALVVFPQFNKRNALGTPRCPPTGPGPSIRCYGLFRLPRGLGPGRYAEL